MGKAARLHREAVQNGTEQPFRQPGQSLKKKSKTTLGDLVSRRDFLNGTGTAVIDTVTGKKGILIKPPTLSAQEDDESIPPEVENG